MNKQYKLHLFMYTWKIYTVLNSSRVEKKTKLIKSNNISKLSLSSKANALRVARAFGVRIPKKTPRASLIVRSSFRGSLADVL